MKSPDSHDQNKENKKRGRPKKFEGIFDDFVLKGQPKTTIAEMICDVKNRIQTYEGQLRDRYIAYKAFRAACSIAPHRDVWKSVRRAADSLFWARLYLADLTDAQKSMQSVIHEQEIIRAMRQKYATKGFGRDKDDHGPAAGRKKDPSEPGHNTEYSKRYNRERYSRREQLGFDLDAMLAEIKLPDFDDRDDALMTLSVIMKKWRDIAECARADIQGPDEELIESEGRRQKDRAREDKLKVELGIVLKNMQDLGCNMAAYVGDWAVEELAKPKRRGRPRKNFSEKRKTAKQRELLRIKTIEQEYYASEMAKQAALPSPTESKPVSKLMFGVTPVKDPSPPKTWLEANLITPVDVSADDTDVDDKEPEPESDEPDENDSLEDDMFGFPGIEP